MDVQAGLRMCWLCEDLKTPYIYQCRAISNVFFLSIIANNFCDALQVADISSSVLQVFIKRLVFHG